MINIRQEQPEDFQAIRTLNEEAFGGPEEANIIEKLRSDCPDMLSLVAVCEDRIVGHILFSPAVIETDNGPVEGMGLAPMAVLAEYQNRGIGRKLIESGLDILRERVCPFIIVLGHPDYYPRFGFERASVYGLRCQWQGVPDEAFMVIFFDETLKQGVSGIARYRDEFDEAM